MNRDQDIRRDPIDDSVVIGEPPVIDESTTDETIAIRADIEQTRANMSETIDALQERLSPTNLKEQAKEQVREQFQEAKEQVREATIGRVENMVHNASDTVSEARYTMMDTIRENPIPAALVGIGLGWLFMNRSSRRPVRYTDRGGVTGTRGAYRGQPYYNTSQGYYDDRQGYSQQRPYYQDQRGYYDDRQGYSEPGMMDRGRQAASSTIDRVQDRAGDLADRARETASNVTGNVTETASNLADRAQETASNLADQAQYQAQRVEDRFESALHSNPLAVGAVALAVGTAVGLALPQTDRENRLMGEARDNLIDRAQDMAQDTLGRVQDVASEVVDETKQTVKEQAREHGLSQ